MSLSPQWLDELRTRTSLTGLIRRTVKLQRAGNEWKACCPFHDEKTPSFYVNDAKGFYHCFGCSAHGDAIRWLTDQRGLAFMDAVKELAAEAGMEVPAAERIDSQRAQQRAGLGEVMQAAQDWFTHNLASPTGATARVYLEKRGLDPHTIARFGFGWAPDRRDALREALARFEDAMLVEAGLLIALEAEPGQTAPREPYDRFRGRLMLPIHDLRGQVIAFGGRILDPASKAPKYLNSPDTPLFDKGRNLYNLHRAAPAARKAGRIIVAEGYMDVIALAAAGIEEVVAPMGTALTDEQLALLWRVIDKPLVCFDGDGAGQRAAMRAVTRALPLLQPGRSLDFVRLPAGMDPDDLVRRDGRDGMEQLLAKAVPLLAMLWEYEHTALPLASPEDKAGLKARLLEQIDTIADKDIRSLYRRDLLDRFSAFAFPRREASAPFASKQGQFARNTNRWAGPAPARLSPERTARLRSAADGGARDSFAQAVLAGLARLPDQIPRHAEALLQLSGTEPRFAGAIDLLLGDGAALDASPRSPISAEHLLAAPNGGTCYSFLTKGYDPDDAREDLAEAVALLVERPALEAAITAATARFDDGPETAFAEQQRLLKRKLELDARLGQLARKHALSGAGNDTADGAYPSADHKPTD